MDNFHHYFFKSLLLVIGGGFQCNHKWNISSVWKNIVLGTFCEEKRFSFEGMVPGWNIFDIFFTIK